MNSSEWRSLILRSALITLCIVLSSKTNMLVAKENAAQNFGSQQYAPELQILSVAWNPDGEHIALGTTRGVVLYNVKNSKISSFNPLDGPISPIAWSPDGTELAGVSQTRHTILIWDVHGQVMGNLVDTSGYIWSMAWSPHNNFLAIGEWGKSIVWNTNSLQQIRIIPTEDYDVMGLAWNPDGRRLALTFNIEGVEIWDVLEGKKVAGINPDRGVQSTSWSPDGTKVVTVGGDTLNATSKCPTCVTWNPLIWSSDGILRGDLHGHSDLIMIAKWSPDGKYILSGSRDGEFIIWDAITRKRADTFTLFPNSFNPEVEDNSVDWSPDGRYLAFATDKGHLGIRDVTRRKIVLDRDLEAF